MNQANSKPIGLAQRILALLVDFSFFGAFYVLPTRLVFGQDYIRESGFDLFGLLLIIAYFWLLPRMGKATIGQWVMGYKIVPAAPGKPEYFYRFIYGLVAYTFSIITIVTERNVKDGIYWWDSRSNTRAISTRRSR